MKNFMLLLCTIMCIAFIACKKSDTPSPSTNTQSTPPAPSLTGSWVCDSAKVSSTENGTYVPYTAANGTMITFSGSNYNSSFKYPLMILGTDNGTFTYTSSTIVLISTVVYHGSQTATVLSLTKTQMEIQINDPATYPNQWYKIWFTFV